MNRPGREQGQERDRAGRLPPGPGPGPGPGSGPGLGLGLGLGMFPEPERETDPGRRPAPIREFAVAEAVVNGCGVDGAETGGSGATAPSPLAARIGRINEAVRTGRIAEALELAETTLDRAVRTAGQEHPEALRLSELTAYVAYLAGDPLRSFRLSLDLARIRHRLDDPRAAYGHVQSAAAAWRAVRDPSTGLLLGGELIGVWTELAAGTGPAADDIEQLLSARARMGRLTERARAAGGAPRRHLHDS
ncbi:hypothetical protein GCM10010145_35870 [Streptomyces ruber]|uniref:Tetratricopeptide repeat protein n=2 Tax=Streptomyces TaxID=1883 RepID=A0A918BFB4_9ACTN|nr:hypothetical protein [Streptomyces ruber]GGQ62806.1 hypothetical protein GCM10010145_35870 [Streptomyces ruber]